MSTTAGLIGLAVSALVVLHELGHWWVAGRCAVKLIPLGGFVQLLDERVAPVAEADRRSAFTRAHPGKRIATLGAAPVANLALGILLLALSL